MISRKHLTYEKKQKVKKRTERNYELLYEYLLKHHCVDCGQTNPVVLEFDHMHDKRYNVSQMLRTHEWNEILKEIGKCEVRCSNCHKLKTAAKSMTRIYLMWRDGYTT